MEFSAEDVSAGGIIVNPFFTVKGHKDLFCGLGIAPQVQVQPQAKRTVDGYSEYAIESLRAGMVVGFDIYLHLRQNEKFIRVVKSGTELDPDQHKHLFGSAKEFHVKETEKKQFQSFFTKLNLQQVFSGKKAA